MSDMPGPNETRLNLIDGVEYITLRADDFRTAMRERDELRAEVGRLKRLYDDVYAENQRLNQALDMLAEQREAWKAKAERLREQFAMSDSDEALMLRAEVERLREERDAIQAKVRDHSLSAQQIVSWLRTRLDRPKE